VCSNAFSDVPEKPPICPMPKYKNSLGALPATTVATDGRQIGGFNRISFFFHKETWVV